MVPLLHQRVGNFHTLGAPRQSQGFRPIFPLGNLKWIGIALSGAVLVNGNGIGVQLHLNRIHSGACITGGDIPFLSNVVLDGFRCVRQLHIQFGVGQEAIVQIETIPSRSIISSPLQAEIMFAGSIQIISIVVLRCISNFQPIAIKLPAICINRYILGCVLPLLLIPLYCIGRSQDDLTPVCNRICGRTNGSIIIFVIDALPIQLNRNLFRPLAVLIVGVVPEQMEGQLLALQGVQAVVAQVDVHVVIVALGGGGDVVGRAVHAGPAGLVLTDLSRVVRKLPVGPVVRHVIGTFLRLGGGGDEMHIGPGGSADQVASGRLHIRAHLHAVGELERLGGLIIVVHGPAGLRLGDEHIVGHQLRGNVHLHLPHAVRKLAHGDAQVFLRGLVIGVAVIKVRRNTINRNAGHLKGNNTAPSDVCGTVGRIKRITLRCVRRQGIHADVDGQNLIVLHLIGRNGEGHLAGKLHPFAQGLKVGDAVALTGGFAHVGVYAEVTEVVADLVHDLLQTLFVHLTGIGAICIAETIIDLPVISK